MRRVGFGEVVRDGFAGEGGGRDEGGETQVAEEEGVEWALREGRGLGRGRGGRHGCEGQREGEVDPERVDRT